MSYDVYLQRFEHGEPAVVAAPEVWELLEEAWESPPDAQGYCRVTRGGDDGDLYAVAPGSPIDALMFNHAGPGIYDLIFDVAVAGDMAIVPPDVGPFVVRPEQREHLPAELRDGAALVGSGEELRRAVAAATGDGTISA